MSHPLRLFLFGLFLAGTACAATNSPAALEFTRLDLLDGRKLRNVVIKSYDARTDKVVLLADQTMMTVSAALIPAPFADGVRKEALALPSTSPAPRVISSVQRSPAPRPQPPVQWSRPASPQSAKATVDLAAHKIAATDRARTFYHTEFKSGSVGTSVVVNFLGLDEPEEITGWEGRYRTQGRAELEYRDRNYRSTGKVNSTFEVITESKSGAAVTVIDFTRKS